MIPATLIAGLARYEQNHTPTGGFLRSVLSGDLFEAALRADDESAACLSELCRHIMLHMPSDSWGSRAKVDRWLK